MTMRRYTVALTTASDGTVTGYTPRVSGKVRSIHYVKHGSTPFADGVDFTITSELTGESIWTESNVNASASRRPRAPTHNQSGVASLYASGGEAVNGDICLANDRMKFAIAQGGNAKLGTFYAVVEG